MSESEYSDSSSSDEEEQQKRHQELNQNIKSILKTSKIMKFIIFIAILIIKNTHIMILR